MVLDDSHIEIGAEATIKLEFDDNFDQIKHLDQDYRPNNTGENIDEDTDGKQYEF
jgi:hypothetical protein